METRTLYRTAKRLRVSIPIKSFAPRSTTSRRCASSKSEVSEQARPVGGFYEILLEDYGPPPTIADAIAQPTPPKNPTGLSQAAKDEIVEKAKVVFGSRLVGPAERRFEIQSKSVVINGVTVPPRPDEPDNCCMGGCVNCVWDRYRDEIEEWSAARKEADAAGRKMMAAKKEKGVTGDGPQEAVSMDDDGGGSDTNWGTGLETDLASDDLFQGVPIGIREFMKQEKKLKEKHAREGTNRG